MLYFKTVLYSQQHFWVQFYSLGTSISKVLHYHIMGTSSQRVMTYEGIFQGFAFRKVFF